MTEYWYRGIINGQEEFASNSIAIIAYYVEVSFKDEIAHAESFTLECHKADEWFAQFEGEDFL